jgi:hypothetical protein
MSENENQTGGEGAGAPAGTVDELKNLKAEMNRKLENTNAQLQQVLAALQTPKPGKSESAPAAKVSVFEDEEAYARRIKDEAKAEVTKELREEAQRTQKYQTIVNQIYSEYPEVSDQNSPLMQRAQEIFKSLPEDEQASAVAMKAAVAQAASEIGVKPKSKRTSSDDDSFSIPSGGGSNSSRRPGREPEIDSKTLELARLMGRDTSDPKYLERLKNAAKRTNWKVYK